MDLIAAMGLGSLVLLIMASDFSALLKHQREAVLFEGGLSGDIRLKSLLEGAVRSQDLFPIEIPFRVFRRGVIRSRERRDIKLSTNPENSPDPESHAVAALELRSRGAFRVYEINGNEFTACPCFTGATFKDIRSIIAMGMEGLTYMLINDTPRRFRSGCYRLSLRRSDNLFVDSTDVFPHLIIPIEREYLLYRSRSKILRYAGFAGTRLIENQPITEIRRSFSARKEPYRGLGHSLRFELKHSTTPHKAIFVPRLEKISIENFLLNSCRKDAH